VIQSLRSANMPSEKPSAAPQPTQRPPDPQASAVQDELRRVYIQQGARTPYIAFLVIGALSWTLHREIPLPVLAGWATLILALLVLRWALCVFLGRADVPPEQLLPRMRAIVALRLLAALTMGSAAVMWFPKILLFDKMIFMVGALAWYATTVIVSLANPISALAFGVFLLGPIALAWTLQESTMGLFVALFTVAIVFFVRQATDGAHAAMRAAIRSRLREEDLARRLERHSAELENAMLAKSRFLAAASHDLRQPVTSMSLLVSAMLASRNEQTMRQVASKLEAPMQALEDILSSLLEVSRLEAGVIKLQRRACSAVDIVAPLLEEYRPRAAAKRLRLNAKVPDLALFTDPDMIRRILRNLLDNAVKFTDVGSVRLELAADGESLVIAVTDTGRGVPKEQHGQVFEDYFQGDNPQRDRRQGMGLGLAIVRRAVGMLGGDITLESIPEKGSRFEVRLPDAVDHFRDAVSVSARSRQPDRQLPAHNVLVVEDDQMVVDAIATLFRTLGINARYALDGEDAFTQTALGRFVPDLALVDFGLPGAMDGITVVQRLRSRLPNCTFLLVTGDTSPEVLRRAADAGVPILHKPVNIQRLNEKLDELGVGV